MCENATKQDMEMKQVAAHRKCSTCKEQHGAMITLYENAAK